MSESHLPNVKTFSVLDAIKGTAYPSAEITVYTDVESLYAIQRLESEAADEQNPDLVDQIDNDIEALRQKIRNSGLTIFLRGISPEIKDKNLIRTRSKFDLNDSDAIIPGSNAFEWLMAAHLAEMIQRVENVDKDADTHHWTPEEVISLMGTLSPSESGRLESKGNELSFQAFSFDEAVTPDFS